MPNANISLQVSLQGTLEIRLPVGSGIQQLGYGANYALASGAGDGQTLDIFISTRTLAASGAENLDLAGSLVDAFGSTITFTKIWALLVKADAANTNDVLFGPAALNGFVTAFNAADDRVRVKPGGTVALIAPNDAGYAVSSGTSDLLTLANSADGSAAKYTIFIAGIGTVNGVPSTALTLAGDFLTLGGEYLTLGA